ncbi:MAG TPA: hypothetical protein VNO30_43570 [Kofleriaceae bacterium]|nr:hypothetical protein [Kofleriaceae bacterium]
MSTKQIQLLHEIRQLPRGEQLRLAERVVHAEEHEPPSPHAIVGLFADQPDLIDTVSEDAMQARERDPLRLAGD